MAGPAPHLRGVPEGCAKRTGENTFRVRLWKTGAFQILASLAKAFSRKEANLKLSGGPGHFMASL